MSATEYKKALLDAILSLLWRQWTGLGVLGYGQPLHNDTFADPEALLITSAKFARYDQRLYDLLVRQLTNNV